MISYESEFFFFEGSEGTCSEGRDDGPLGEGFVGLIPEGVEVSFFTTEKVSESGYGILEKRLRWLGRVGDGLEVEINWGDIGQRDCTLVNEQLPVSTLST